MPTTRSTSRRQQTTLESLQAGDQLLPTVVQRPKSKKRSSSVSVRRKRKGTSPHDAAPRAGGAKRTKTKHESEHEENDDDDVDQALKLDKRSAEDNVAARSKVGSTSVFKSKSKQSESKPDQKEVRSRPDRTVINRAPVLQLWAACVTQRLYSDIPFETCLSVGSAISAFCAVAKGRAVGVIQPKNKSVGEEQARKEPRRGRGEDEGEDEVVDVMHFTIPVRKGVAVLEGKQKRANEEALMGKFGGEEAYERVKTLMEESLATWTGKEDELNKRAFRMYEDFRPVVPQGQKGWGRKGELDLERIRKAIQS